MRKDWQKLPRSSWAQNPNPTNKERVQCLAARGKSRAGAKNGDCHQFAPLWPRNKALSLKRIGWLCPIFRFTATTGYSAYA